jgi:hypothetical protein
MAFEFTFQIDPERIVIQDAQIRYRLGVNNRVVYRQKDGRLLALGETEKVVRARLGGQYDWEAGEVRSCSLFGADGAELAYEIQAMQYFTRLLHHQSHGVRPAAHFIARLGNGFDYFLTVQDYETFPEARRNTLEQSLQAHLRMRRLVINGRAVHIPVGKRILELWLRRLLTLILPLAAILAGYLTIPRSVASSPFTFLFYLLVISYSSYYGGKIAWMLLSRRIVPADYRLYMLQGARAKLANVDRLLVRVFWGLTPTS